MAEFRMPSLGADMDEGTVVAWRVAVGDHVDKGDIVAEVDTDKSVIEVETFTSGVVTELLVPEGDRVPVGTPLATISAEKKAPARRRTGVEQRTGRKTAASRPPRAPAPADEPAPVNVAARSRAPGPAPRARPSRAPAGTRVASSPLARRHAEALGIDLATVPGTGPGGAVTTVDVEHFAAARSAAATEPTRTAVPITVPVTVPAAARPTKRTPTSGEPGTGATPVTPLSGAERQAALRRAVAAAMARSKREIPHFYLATDIDLHRATTWLDEHNASVPVTDRVLLAALQLKAVALALREVPELNGHWLDDALRPAENVHLGVAIALRGGGLVAPAIHDADRLSVTELMAALHDLVGRARAGRIRSSEMSDPTATVTNLGDQGVDAVQPVINPPQVAMVGFGRVRDRAWAVDGMLTVRPVTTASLAADHRVTDGHRGAALLAAIDRLLQQPDRL
ncbi:2-oxo acid dehydrogenase subunit E2 [Actinotalea sp. M2MS4P-6]|uniref:dihydrolipoamide acetyltransferase family protein n=1 Tax=Actinotalea sp. M2MS4P-6 TaxID=2983762 RepID=UPI0021E40C2A|nr:dihydrolipoamide acetyltransferase family protein [Actinotalea sp. M2MS4P-6]MCV2394236.1 2-oxo acid dehydrogenase subunit E2 [Actinotalea sp. M2MS4P-6]